MVIICSGSFDGAPSGRRNVASWRCSKRRDWGAGGAGSQSTSRAAFGLKVDHQRETGRLLDGKIAGFGPVQSGTLRNVDANRSPRANSAGR